MRSNISGCILRKIVYFLKNKNAWSGDRTHAALGPPGLKSGILTTRSSTLFSTPPLFYYLRYVSYVCSVITFKPLQQEQRA
jgi:hypothetical protein